MADSVTEWVAETALKHGASQGPGFARRLVRELAEHKKVVLRDHLHLTRLAKTLFGEHTWEQRLHRVSARAEWVGEATEAVDLTAWRDILGVVAVEQMEVGYREATSVVDQLHGEVPSEDEPENQMTIPYPSVATDPGQDTAPGTEFPKTGFAGYKIRTPLPVKHGLIAQLTFEVVRANRRKGFLDALMEVGRVVGREKVYRLLKLIVGVTNNYTVVSVDGTATTRNTFVTTAGAKNLLTDLNLANGPKEIDRLQQLFSNMLDPLTGEPIEVTGSTVLTSRANLYTFNEAAQVQEIRTTVSGVETVTGNPVTWNGAVVTDIRLPKVLVTYLGLTAAQAATWVAMGDFVRAFKWRRVRDFETEEAGPDDPTWPPAFYQEIVYACRGLWEGCPFVADPYAVLSAYNASAT
jgi:hypothetical protein